MIVKVCGLNNQTNALEISLTGVDMLGFIFHSSSPRFIQQAFDEYFNESIPKAVKRVGVFVDAPQKQIIDIVTRYSLDYVQLHGSESPDYCAQLKAKGISVIKAFAVGDNFDFDSTNAYSHGCSMFLFDAAGRARGGNGISFSWHLLNRYVGETPFLLSGGISLHHLSAVKELKHPALVGFDINSRFEISPGVKDVAKVRDFIEAIRNKKQKVTENNET